MAKYAECALLDCMKDGQQGKKPADEMAGDKLKSYGQQSPGMTIKSISLSKELAEYAQKQAEAQGVSVSKWISELLQRSLEDAEDA